MQNAPCEAEGVFESLFLLHRNQQDHLTLLAGWHGVEELILSPVLDKLDKYDCCFIIRARVLFCQ